MLPENKRKFLKESKGTLKNILASLEELPTLQMSTLEKSSTVLIVLDVINGFAKEGALYSPRVEGIIPYIQSIMPFFEGFQKVFFADAHHKESKEFDSYPEHCLIGTAESEIVEELKPYLEDNGTLCLKNSTNGFFSKDFSEWLMKNPKVNNYVIVGDCTDLCVLQFALSIKGYFNEWDVTSNIIIPVQGVETYDMESSHHQADLMNLFALYNMKMNGIEVVKQIIT